MSSSTPRRRGSHDAFSPTPPWMMMMMTTMTTMTPSTTMRTPRSRVARRAKTSPSPSPSNASARRRVRGARRVADGWLHSVGRHHCRPRRLCCRPVVVVVVGHAVGDARCAMRGASSSSSSSSVGRQHRRRARDTNARASSELDASDGRAAPRWFFFGVARIGVRISRVRHSLTRSVCTRDDDDDDDERKQPTNHRTHSPRCDHGCTTSTRRAG